MTRLRFFFVLVVVLLIAPSLAFAFYRNPVNSQPGFSRTEILQQDDNLAGKQLDGARIIRSSPVVSDLDGNPSNGLEIVIGDRNGKLFALRNNGQVMWTTQVASCSVTGDDSLLNGAPPVRSETRFARPGSDCRLRQNSGRPELSRWYPCLFGYRPAIVELPDSDQFD